MKLIIAAFAAAMVATTVHGQASPDSIKRRNDCRLAEQVLRTGHPAPHLVRATGTVRRCPSAGASVAEAMLRFRTSTDTALLNAITSPAIELRDGDVYRTALDIAADRTASVAARVFAFRTLVWTLEPGGWIDYADLADEVVVGRRICNRHGAHFHLSVTRGAPIPTDYVQAIRSLGRATEYDSTVPRQVRRAAECARRQPAMDLTGR